MALLIGSHVDQEDPIAEAAARGAQVVQFFFGDPQKWKAPAVAYEGGAEALKAAAAAAGVELYVHAAYIINVASTNNRVRIPSRKLLQQTVKLAAECGAKGVVVHGGHITEADAPDAGFENWRKAVDQLEQDVPVLIENTAGGQHAMARRRDAIGKLWDAVGHSGVGFCLDTCHAFAGGLDLSDVVAQVKGITGRIDLVHANDSQGGFDSGIDRHANFASGEHGHSGEGAIGGEAVAAVIKAAGAPAVCETPNGADAQAADIKWLRDRVA